MSFRSDASRTVNTSSSSLPAGSVAAFSARPSAGSAAAPAATFLLPPLSSCRIISVAVDVTAPPTFLPLSTISLPTRLSSEIVLRLT